MIFLLKFASVQRVGERVLVTTLTKRMAEDLTDYYSNVGVRIRYLHEAILMRWSA